MASLAADLRYSLRILVKKPGFTLIAVLALALGIGANTAIFSVVNGVLLKALPYEDSDRIVVIWETNPALGLERTGPSGPNYLDWRERSTVFDEMAVLEPGSATFVGLGEPTQIPGMRVSPSLLKLLGGEMAIGRWFTEEEGRETRVAVLSHDFWKNRLGSDPAVIGRKFKTDGLLYEVIGVAAPEFWSPVPAECFVPWSDADLRASDRMGHDFGVLGRLKPGVTVKRAEDQLAAIHRALGGEYPELRSFGVSVVPLDEALVEGIRTPLIVLLAAVGFVLLIACANVANLMLTRMSNRRRELAMRAAIGATRFQVARQLLAESLTLALLGGISGLLVALWGVALLRNLLPGTIPIPNASAEALLATVEVDLAVLAFTLALALGAGILFGLAPAVYALREEIGGTLKHSSRGASSSLSEGRVRDALVVAEVALALVLLIGAGLMISTFRNLRQAATGFRTDGVLTLQMELPTDSRYRLPRERQDLLRTMLEEIRAVPGVESTGLTSVLPLDPRAENIDYLIEGHPPLPDGVPRLLADFSQVSPDYFNTLGIPLVRGRFFTDRDNRDNPRVALISRSLADQYFSASDPLGRRLLLSGDSPWEIVGVVGDVRHAGLDRSPKPTIYLPYYQSAGDLLTLVARTPGDPKALASSVKKAVWSVDDKQPLFRIRTMDEVVEQSRAAARLTVVLLGVFAGLALVMAAIGVYGVLSFSVNQRRREIGVRMAIGARSADVFGGVLRRSLLLAAAGVAIGLFAGALLAQLLGSLLYGVSATDPSVFAAVAVTLLGVAALASYLPARRAARTDPATTLRYE